MRPDEGTGDLEFATVRVERMDEAIRSVKRTLPSRERRCGECGYAARTDRWGIRSHDTTDPGLNALVLCCPACETPVDLSAGTE